MRDVELTVVHTYLLAGEILGLLPDKEAVTLLTPPPMTEQEPASHGTIEEPANDDDVSGDGSPGTQAQRDAKDEGEARDD